MDNNHITVDLAYAFTPILVVNPDDVKLVPTVAIAGVKLSRHNAAVFVTMMQSMLRFEKRFVVVLEDPGAVAEVVELLLHALFQKNYLFIDSRPVILLRCDTDLWMEHTSHIDQVLMAQGFPGGVKWHLSTSVLLSRGGMQPVVVNESVHITESWRRENLFGGFETLSNFVVFDFADSAIALERASVLIRSCMELLHQHPLLQKGFSEYKQLKQQTGKNAAANVRLAQQLAGADKTIGVIRTKYKDDYENLFKWYHNEYEILPLWYKRVGHIIKVLMGKRSFRSLFSDDVKKYKD